MAKSSGEAFSGVSFNVEHGNFEIIFGKKPLPNEPLVQIESGDLLGCVVI